MASLEKFISAVDDDLAWRKKEITNFLLLANEDNEHLIVKASILLIYSHWEGFVKNSCKEYLSYISDKSLKLNELASNFTAITLKGLIKELSESSETLTLTNELKFIEHSGSSSKKIFKVSRSFQRSDKDKSIINTKDNLNLSVFDSLLKIVGLGNKDCLVTKKNYLDQRLLHNRNKIAHGSRISPDDDIFDISINGAGELKDFVFSIMSTLADDLKKYAESEFYLLKNQQESAAYNQESNLSLEQALKKIIS